MTSWHFWPQIALAVSGFLICGCTTPPVRPPVPVPLPKDSATKIYAERTYHCSKMVRSLETIWMGKKVKHREIKDSVTESMAPLKQSADSIKSGIEATESASKKPAPAQSKTKSKTKTTARTRTAKSGG